jgi:hypothetical protein
MLIFGVGSRVCGNDGNERFSNPGQRTERGMQCRFRENRLESLGSKHRQRSMAITSGEVTLTCFETWTDVPEGGVD